MEEKQLEILFRKFLLNKGFTNGNMLSQVALRTTGEGVFRPDLVIIDLDNMTAQERILLQNRIITFEKSFCLSFLKKAKDRILS